MLINHDCKTSCGLIQDDGLFTNWQFGSLTDPCLHDLQLLVLVVCPFCILVLLGELKPWSLLNKIRLPSQICHRVYFALKLPPPAHQMWSKQISPCGGAGELNRGFGTWQKTSVRLKFNNKMLVKYWTLITCETKECIPFLERILRPLVTLKTVITQDIREQRNVGIPLSLGYFSNRMHWYWPLEKKWQTSQTRKSSWKQKWWVIP